MPPDVASTAEELLEALHRRDCERATALFGPRIVRGGGITTITHDELVATCPGWIDNVGSRVTFSCVGSTGDGRHHVICVEGDPDATSYGVGLVIERVEGEPRFTAMEAGG